MKFCDFIIALEKAGWRAMHDSQHTGIDALHRKLFPVVAELEDDVLSLEEEAMQLERERNGLHQHLYHLREKCDI